MSQPATQRGAHTREDILAELARQASALRLLGVTTLGLFGSYARNEQTQTSDVDLLVEFDHLTFRSYMDAKLLLEAALGLSVDLVLANDLRPRLRERVLNEAIGLTDMSR
ncbi:MAG: nucleotidyltransferase family protein [Ktedonobacterales bacterium]